MPHPHGCAMQLQPCSVSATGIHLVKMADRHRGDESAAGCEHLSARYRGLRWSSRSDADMQPSTVAPRPTVSARVTIAISTSWSTSMRRLLSALALLACVAVAHAADKPDLSGSWKMNAS